jgi:hypothetical protein
MKNLKSPAILLVLLSAIAYSYYGGSKTLNPVSSELNLAQKKDQVCAMIYDPVCSIPDSVTYPNACEAKKAGVIRYVKGACEK